MAVKETIIAASIARVTSKAGKLLGFLVKSNHTKEYYQVTVTRVANEHIFTCTCKAGQFGFKGCRSGHCAHVQAVLEVAAARMELKKAAEQGEASPAQVAQEAMTQAAEKQIATIVFPNAKTVAVKRAPQFTPAQLKQLASPANAPFSLLKPAW